MLPSSTVYTMSNVSRPWCSALPILSRGEALQEKKQRSYCGRIRREWFFSGTADDISILAICLIDIAQKLGKDAGKKRPEPCRVVQATPTFLTFIYLLDSEVLVLINSVYPIVQNSLVFVNRYYVEIAKHYNG